MYKTILIICGLFTLIVFNSCEKEEPATIPVLSTTPVTNITINDAVSGGVIISDGGANITTSGICWGTSPEPTTNNSKTEVNVSNGQFVSLITGLTPGNTYHVRAYATNEAGTGYGANLQFTTSGSIPSSITLPVCCISTNGATLNGIVNPNGINTTVAFEYGLTTSYGETVNAIESPLTGLSNISVSAAILGLNPGTTYHYRVKAENLLGITYGNDCTFTTNPLVPIKSGLYTIKTGTDDLYFIDLNTNTFNKVADIGLTVESMFMGMQYKDHKLYISYGAKLYTYNMLTSALSLVISNTNLAWQFSINSLGELYSVTEVTGIPQGSFYKINIADNSSVRIGGTNAASIWGLGFDANDILWSVEELIQRYGTINTATGAFTATSSTIPYTDTYYATPDNNGNLYSFNVGNPATGIVKYNINSNSATMLIPLTVTWTGLAFGLY